MNKKLWIFKKTQPQNYLQCKEKVLFQGIEREPTLSKFKAYKSKTLEMCGIVVEEDQYRLEFVPMDLITRETCNKVKKNYPWSLIYVSDCYVKLQQISCKGYSHAVTLESQDLIDDLVK